MQNSKVLLVLLVAVSALGFISAASNVTVIMDDYVRDNQRQYDAKLKSMEDEMATFREIYARELRVIAVQADQLQNKIEEANAKLHPMELIDSWHKQCVQNYTSNLPLVATVRSALTTCSTGAQNNLASYLTNAQNTLNSLRSYYNNNLKTMLNNCEKQHPVSHANYSTCVTDAIATTNTYTISAQKNFNTYMETAGCSATSRINVAWDCSFTTVHNTISTLSVALRLVNDCIANKLTCASVSCTTGCKNHMIVNLSQTDFLNATISNPFYGLNSNLGCMEVKFKL